MQKYALAADASTYLKSNEQPDPSARYLLALSLREMQQLEEATQQFDLVIQQAAGTEYFLKPGRKSLHAVGLSGSFSRSR
jgi:hypothetical protein